MRSVVVHIGMPKAGSTTIQRFLHQNRLKLIERGVLYPAAAGAPTHHPLVQSLRGRQEGDALVEALLHELDERKPETILFSSESFSVLSDAQVRLFSGLLAKLGGTVTVVCYLRRQDEAALSRTWNMALRGATELDFPPSNASLNASYDYYAAIKRWADVFGAENIRVRRFGEPYLAGADLIDDFMSTVGLSNDATLWQPSPKNVSPDARQIQFLWRLNRNNGGWTKRDRWMLMKVLQPLSDGPKVGAARTARQAFVAQFEETNRLVAKEFLGIDGPLFDHPFPDDAPVALTLDDVLPFVQAIIERRMTWSTVRMGAVSLSRSSERAARFLGRWALDNVSPPRGPVLDEQVIAYVNAFEAEAIAAGILLDEFEDCALDIQGYIRDHMHFLALQARKPKK